MNILIAGTGGIADEFERYIANSVTVMGNGYAYSFFDAWFFN